MFRSVSSVLTKFKSKVIKPIIFNQPLLRHFGETSVEVSNNGHFMMRVQLFPYTENDITVVREGNQITLEARTGEGEVIEKHTSYTEEWPYESRTTVIKKTYSSSPSVRAYQTLVLPPDLEPGSVKTRFERGDFVVTGYMRPTKVKNTHSLPFAQNVGFPARYFGDEIMEVTKKGDILLKVKIHPYSEKEVKHRIDGNIVTLEVKRETVHIEKKEVPPPPGDYHKGEKASEIRKKITSSYVSQSYVLPLDTNKSSLKTKFEDGYFVLTAKRKQIYDLVCMKSTPVRYFGESVLDVLSNGDLTLKVRLHPFQENQVKYHLDGTTVKLVAEASDSEDSVTAVEWPSSILPGRKSLRSSTTTSFSKAIRTYHLPDGTDINSIKTKFERGYFVLTAIVKDWQQ